MGSGCIDFGHSSTLQLAFLHFLLNDTHEMVCLALIVLSWLPISAEVTADFDYRDLMARVYYTSPLDRLSES